ncbi:hypothetical protein IGI46_001020 [Enterococcus sp. AZ163]
MRNGFYRKKKEGFINHYFTEGLRLTLVTLSFRIITNRTLMEVSSNAAFARIGLKTLAQ